MAKNDLSRLCYLNREILRDRERLKKLEAKAAGTGGKLPGLPHVDILTDKTALAAEIADAKAVIEDRIKKSVREYARLYRVIARVEDPFIREILTSHFLEGYSWKKTAERLGGGNTPDSVRMAVKRWMGRKK